MDAEEGEGAGAPRIRRRGLLRGAALAAGTLGVAWLGWRAGFVQRRLARATRAATHPELPAAPPGPLAPAVEATLLALAEALVDRPVTPAPYLQLLRFRAEQLPGYRALYERFAAALEASARATGAPGFAALAPAARRERLRKLGVEPAGPTRGLAALFRREANGFSRYAVEPLLQVFDRTDAWLAVGYAAHPGTPRGLAGYTQPPGAA